MTPCMTPDEWSLWQDANGLLKPHQRARRPCSDCPASFAVANRAAGTCDGHPYGVLPAGDRAERRREQWRAYRARVRRFRERSVDMWVPPNGDTPDNRRASFPTVRGAE